MSVAEQLGLRDETSELLALADQRWGLWATSHPALTHCCGVRELRSWLRSADKAEADAALHALATLAAVDGGDDIAAAAALAWALMPGACTLANRLRTLDWHIDEIVAAQLWVEVRTFPWRRLRKVAANVLLNTRTGVLRDCNAKSQLERTDPTWSRTSPVDPYAHFWGYASIRGQHPASPGQELLKLLAWGCKNRVITDDDRALLLCLVEAADGAATRKLGRGTGGLMANNVSEAVAQQWGISPSTVRRRARRSMDALSSACTGTDGRVSA
ncbi:MAG: hypothetical protein HHJ11_02415 [Phycicoccus sp.]|jgi:hypothetical protein|nr:hypothetical protein [Phycicoccus sp.]